MISPRRIGFLIATLLIASLAATASAQHRGEQPHGDPDAFGRFYLQQRELFYTMPSDQPDQRLHVLDELQRAASGYQDSPYHGGAMTWIAQELSSNGRPERAIPIFDRLLNSETASGRMREIVRFERGLAEARRGKTDSAEADWAALMRDGGTSEAMRSMAAEHLRTSAMRREDWTAARAVAEHALANGLGQSPVLHETVARAARRTGDVETAERHYQTILDQYPQYRPTNRMLYITKAAITSRHQGKRGRIEYLTEMGDAVRDYERRAAEDGTMFAEVYQELYNLGMGYVEAAAAYEADGRRMPISREEARARALEHLQQAIEGVKNLPGELRGNIEFDAVVHGAYMAAAQILAAQGKNAQALQLLDEFLNTFSDIDPDRLIAAQRLITTLEWGDLGPDILRLGDNLDEALTFEPASLTNNTASPKPQHTHAERADTDARRVPRTESAAGLAAVDQSNTAGSRWGAWWAAALLIGALVCGFWVVRRHGANAVSMIALMLTLMLPLAQQPIRAESATAKRGPLVCAQPVFQFGDLDNYRVLSHRFLVENRGEEPVRIEDVSFECSCTRASLSHRVIPPKGQIEVTVLLNLRELRGDVGKSLILKTNRPEQPFLRLQMQGRALQKVVVDPPAANFGEIDAAVEHEKFVTIAPGKGEQAFKILRVVSSETWLEAMFMPGDGIGVHQIRLRTRKPLPIGTIRSTVKVSTDRPFNDVLEIPVVADAKGPLTVLPDEILLLDRQSGSSTASRYVRLRSTSKEPFEIIGVEVPSEHIDVSIDSLPDSGYVVRLMNIPVTPELDRTEIVIKTNVEGFEAFSLPIRVLSDRR